MDSKGQQALSSIQFDPLLLFSLLRPSLVSPCSAPSGWCLQSSLKTIFELALLLCLEIVRTKCA